MSCLNVLFNRLCASANSGDSRKAVRASVPTTAMHVPTIKVIRQLGIVNLVDFLDNYANTNPYILDYPQGSNAYADEPFGVPAFAGMTAVVFVTITPLS